MRAAWVTVVLSCVACSGATVNMKTQQDYENVVVELVKQVIQIFKDDGMNCEVLSHDLRDVSESAKFKAAKQWKKDPPEQDAELKTKLEPYKDEFVKAATPGLRQCGDNLEAAFAALTQ